MVRPQVRQLSFQVFTRALHPELFETWTFKRFRRGDQKLTIRLTPTGHVIEWTNGSLTLTEVTATPSLELPLKGRIYSQAIGSHQTSRHQLTDVHYSFSTVAECLAPEIFRHLHQELAADGARQATLFLFRPQPQVGFSPLGLVQMEPVPRGVSLATFHTFPDEFTIVKTQTLIESVVLEPDPD